MKDRLMQVVKYKTNGRMGKFGELLGWKAQYTHRVLSEGSIGIQPVIAVLNAFPEINARWLLLGEGSMLDKTYSYDDLCRKALDLVRYEKYICVMTDEELTKFVNTNEPFSNEDVSKWQMMLKDKEDRLDNIFASAYNRIKNEHTEIANRG